LGKAVFELKTKPTCWAGKRPRASSRPAHGFLAERLSHRRTAARSTQLRKVLIFVMMHKFRRKTIANPC
jgi:hypothetical protein